MYKKFLRTLLIFCGLTGFTQAVAVAEHDLDERQMDLVARGLGGRALGVGAGAAEETAICSIFRRGAVLSRGGNCVLTVVQQTHSSVPEKRPWYRWDLKFVDKFTLSGKSEHAFLIIEQLNESGGRKYIRFDFGPASHAEALSIMQKVEGNVKIIEYDDSTGCTYARSSIARDPRMLDATRRRGGVGLQALDELLDDPHCTYKTCVMPWELARELIKSAEEDLADPPLYRKGGAASLFKPLHPADKEVHNCVTWVEGKVKGQGIDTNTSVYTKCSDLVVASPALHMVDPGGILLIVPEDRDLRRFFEELNFGGCDIALQKCGERVIAYRDGLSSCIDVGNVSVFYRIGFYPWPGGGTSGLTRQVRAIVDAAQLVGY